MNNINKLTKLMAENPDIEVIFLYPEDGSGEYYTFGKTYKVELDEYTIANERVWWKSNETELFEEMADAIANDLYSYMDFPLSEEQEKDINRKAEEFMKTMNWKRAIMVYIQPR